jgi:hypothetical protein
MHEKRALNHIRSSLSVTIIFYRPEDFEGLNRKKSSAWGYSSGQSRGTSEKGVLAPWASRWRLLSAPQFQRVGGPSEGAPSTRPRKPPTPGSEQAERRTPPQRDAPAGVGGAGSGPPAEVRSWSPRFLSRNLEDSSSLWFSWTCGGKQRVCPGRIGSVGETAPDSQPLHMQTHLAAPSAEDRKLLLSRFKKTLRAG